MKQFIILLCVVAFLNSCQTIEDANSSVLKVSDLEYVGCMHNDFMNNINKSFININDNEMSKEKCIDFVLDCNLEYLKQKNFINSERQSIAQDFIKYKNFVNVNQFRNNINKKESRSLNSTDYNLEKMAQDSIINIDDLPSLKELANQALSEGVLDKKCYNILFEIISLIEESDAGLISDQTLEKKINDSIDKFDKCKYSKDSPVGVNTACILAVSNSSVQWWKENPNAMIVEEKIPAVVVTDIAGAIVGGLSNMAGQVYLAKGKSFKFNFNSCIYSIGAGAITGSCGLVGKLGRYIKMLF